MVNDMNKIQTFIITLLIFFGFILNAPVLIPGELKNEIATGEKSENKPEMFFEEQVYNFGKMYTGENVKHEFKFKNVGRGELTINNVKSSCGCTAALVSKNKLHKDEEGVVEVKFNSGHYVGKVTKSVVVNSNDPVNSKYKLTITGEVIEEVSVSPKRINFGIIRKGDSCTKNIEIKTVPELKIVVKKVESPSSYITITQHQETENSYQVIFSDYEYLGKFSGILFVYTSSNKQERIDVPFSGEVVGDVTFYPETLSFGSVKYRQDVKKTVIINFINKEVQIKKVEVEPVSVNYTISDLHNISTKKIEVKLGDTMSGRLTGSLRIYTNSAIQPVINIPINGEIKG